MTTLEKLSSLQHYMVGQTAFQREDKKYFACIYDTSALEFAQNIEKAYDLPEEVIELEVLYASTMEEVINLAYEVEQNL